MKKANEILKKDVGVDLQLLTNREKTLLVDALKETYALSDLRAGPDWQVMAGMTMRLGHWF